MKKAISMSLVLLLILVLSGATPSNTIPDEIYLTIEQLRPCTCAERVKEGTLPPGPCVDSGMKYQGTILNIGGGRVSRIFEKHNEGSWNESPSSRESPIEHENTGNGMIAYGLNLKILDSNFHPIYIGGVEHLGNNKIMIVLKNNNAATGFRIYLGNTMLNNYLICGLEGSIMQCNLQEV